MARKEFDMKSESKEIMMKAKKRYGLRSDSETINFIIHMFSEKEREQAIFEVMRDQYADSKKLFDRIRLGVNNAEKGTQVVKEMLNNYFLFNHEPEEAFFPIEKDKHFITGKAEEEVQRRFKIMRDQKKEASRKNKMFQ